MNLIEEQIESERNMHASGLRKYMASIEEAYQDNADGRTQHGMKTVAQAILPFEQKIKEYRERPRHFNDRGSHFDKLTLSDATLALITLEHLVAGMRKDRTLVVLAKKVGQAVENESRWSALAAKDERFHFNIMKQAIDMKGYDRARYLRYMDSKAIADIPRLTLQELVNIGTTLVSLLCGADLGFDLKITLNKKGNIHYKVAMDEKRAAFVQKAIIDGILKVADLEPMVVTPKRWTSQDEGGYYTHHVGTHSIVRGPMQPGDFESMGPVVEALNKVQEQGWILDRDVTYWYDLVMRAGLHGEVSGMVKRAEGDDAVPLTLLLAHHKLTQRLADREFYVPHNLCWRGRLMAMPTFSFQGPDYCRGLMRFAHGTPVGKDGAKWISLHMANSYGDDKISLVDRWQWADDNRELVVRVASNPMQNFDDWRNADAPWQFLSACFEWKRYMDSGYSPNFKSNLPIGMDGSSNALQHGSAFLKDAEGAAWVNMREAGIDEKPADLYRRVSDEVNKRLLASDDELAKQWLQVGVDRKVCKRIVMTRGYAGNKYGAADMVLEDTVSFLKDHPFKSEGAASVFLAAIIHEESMRLLKGLSGTMEFLQGAVGDKPIVFRLPTGFMFRQAYWQKKVKRVKMKSLPIGRVDLQLKVDTEKIDKRKMRAGISANFTHACDAAHLVGVVSAFDGPLGLVHDSYSTTAGFAEDMYRTVRTKFHELHIQDMLDSFNRQQPEQRDLPKPGCWDVMEIERAPYAFL